MRLEFESNISALPVSDAVAEHEISEVVSAKTREMLHDGIRAAQAGNRAEARHLLLKVTEVEPRNENAWLWLASISEYPEELLVFLKNVLDVNPDNQRALQWTKATKSLLAKTFVQRGIDATKEDQKEFANQCFNHAIAQDEENELAWLWMASVSDSDEEKLAYLEKALTLDPENEDAKRAVASVWEKFGEARLEAAYSAAAQGDRQTANENLDQLFEKFPESEEGWMLRSDLTEDPAEKTAILEKVLSINPENDDALGALEALRRQTVEYKLQAASDAVAEGRREEASAMVEELLAASPEMEEAWVLKSKLVEDHDEKVRVLSKVLELNPNNEDAAAALDSLHQQALAAKLGAAGAAADEGRREEAAALVEELLAASPEMEEAWVLRSRIADGQDEKVSAFEKVLELNPNNEEALAGMESIKRETVRKQLQSANVAAIEGNREKAAGLLEEVLNASPDMEEAWVLKSLLAEGFDEKIRAFEKVLELNPENLAAKVGLESLNAIMRSAAPDAAEEPEAPLVAQDDSEVVAEDHSHNEVVEEAHFDNGPVEAARFDDGVAEDRNPTQDLELPRELLENSPFESEPAPETESYSNLDSPAGSFPADYSFSEDPWPTDGNLEEVAGTVEELYPQGEASENTISEEDNSFEQVEENEPVRMEEYTAPAEAPFVPEQAVWDNVQPESEVAESDYSEQSFASQETEIFEYKEDSETGPTSSDEDPTGSLSFTEENGSREEVSHPQAEGYNCPFCEAENDLQAFVCKTCSAMLSLSDLEMLLAHPHADRDIVDFAVEQMEAERGHRELNEYELKALGIGHLNLKNFEQGLGYLQESQRLNPNDVLLGGQINALSIRLSEIREQAQAHDSMVKGKTILVVDDSATVRKLIAGKLEKCGHEVVCAVDGVDALEKMEELVPDLILLDINMPRMDGYQVCKLIRNNHATENVPVVMISGKDGFFDKVRGRMSGTTGYITKPFGPETLMKALETYIKNDAPEQDHSEE